MPRARLAVPLAVAGLLIASAVAPAQTGRDTVSLKLTSKRPASAAGFSVKATFAPERVIDQITIALPTGTKFAPGAVPTCTLTREQLEAGQDCPANTRIGTGSATAVLGTSPPAEFQLVAYNRPGGQYVDIVLNGEPAFLLSPRITGRKLVIPLPLTPQLNARITRFAISYPRAGTRAKPYLRTPRRCPSSGRLSGAVEARAAGATVVTRATVRCTRPKR